MVAGWGDQTFRNARPLIGDRGRAASSASVGDHLIDQRRRGRGAWSRRKSLFAAVLARSVPPKAIGPPTTSASEASRRWHLRQVVIQQRSRQSGGGLRQRRSSWTIPSTARLRPRRGAEGQGSVLRSSSRPPADRRGRSSPGASATLPAGGRQRSNGARRARCGAEHGHSSDDDQRCR